MAKSLMFGYKGFKVDKYGPIRKSPEAAQLRNLDEAGMERFKTLMSQSLMDGISKSEKPLVTTMVDYMVNQIVNPDAKDKLEASKTACEQAGWTVSKGKIGNQAEYNPDVDSFSKDSLQKSILDKIPQTLGNMGQLKDIKQHLTSSEASNVITQNLFDKFDKEERKAMCVEALDQIMGSNCPDASWESAEYKSVAAEVGRVFCSSMQAIHEVALKEVTGKIRLASQSLAALSEMKSQDATLIQELKAEIDANKQLLSQIQQNVSASEAAVLQSQKNCDNCGWNVPENATYTKESIQQEATRRLSQVVTEKLAAKAEVSAEKDISSKAKI